MEHRRSGRVERSEGGSGALYPFAQRSSLLYDRALRARRNPTRQESLLWAAIVKAKIADHFVRQRVFLPDYYADIVCPGRRLIIEVDGPVHDRQREYDAKRDEALRKRGYEVVRLLNAEVEDDAGAVVQYLQQTFNIYPRTRNLYHPIERQQIFTEPPYYRPDDLPRDCMECRVKQRLCAQHALDDRRGKKRGR